MAADPPSTVDDEFDHDESTKVDRDKEAPNLQIELDRVQLVELTKRVGALEDKNEMLAGLVRQLIDRVEDLERLRPVAGKTTPES